MHMSNNDLSRVGQLLAPMLIQLQITNYWKKCNLITITRDI